MAKFIGRTDVRKRFDEIADAQIGEKLRMERYGKELGAEVLEYWKDEDFLCEQWAMKRMGLDKYTPKYISRSPEFVLKLAMDKVSDLKLTEDLEDGLLVGYLRYFPEFFEQLRSRFDNFEEAHDTIHAQFTEEGKGGYKEAYKHFGVLREIEGKFHVDSKFGNYHVFRTPLEFDYYSSYVDFFKRVDREEA